MRNSAKKELDEEIAATNQLAEGTDAQAFWDPDAVLDLVLSDIELLLEQKYPVLAKHTDLFNISRLNFLLGGQFRIARLAREQGVLIQDCEMCIHYDKELSYCQYYRLIFTQKDDLYYYSGLCPALKTD
ncbi:hypothetical protein [Sporomusa aerivorans]|uniref:hypothetical protein n=1 Tax=Sporomusa aerivorans TaxID=204936 RepID=UPI00352B60FE